MRNARQIRDTNIQILSEIRNAISDLYERENQLLALEEKFSIAMNEVQIEAKEVSTIDDTLRNFERELQIVQTSSAQMQKRLNDVTIEQAFPQEQDNLYKKNNLRPYPVLPTHWIKLLYRKRQLLFF